MTRTRTRADQATLAALTADPQNRRRHDQRNLDAIASSLKEVGAARSIVIDEDNLILAGNGVTQAARAAGLTKLRVIEATGDEIIAVRRRGLTDAQKRALALYDNRTAELATWNVEQLVADQAAGLDLSAWWTDEELAALLTPNGGPKQGKTDPDAVPEVRATDVQRGDLFALGAHRLLCGDATDAVDVARVMGSEKAALCLTDPPYGIGESYASFTDTAENLGVLIAAFFPLARRAADRLLLTPGNGNQRLYPVPDWTLCWFIAAGTGRSSWGFSCWQPVLAYGSDPYLAAGKGARPDALGQTESAENTLGHPCPKPVGVWSWFIERGSPNAGERVLDVFAGSGTTLIACEQLTRACRALEIEPQYVQVALDRWAAFTGQTPQKVGEAVRSSSPKSVTPASVTHGRQKTTRAARETAAPAPPPQPAPARRRREKARP